MIGFVSRFCGAALKGCLFSRSRLANLLLVLSFGASSCVSYRALGWGAGGHMVVAQIAYNHLDPGVKAKCDALITVPLAYRSDSTSNFVTGAVWADDYKSQLSSSTWHYIDLAFSLDGTSTNGVGPDPENVVWAINQSLFTLGNPTSTQTDQATALRYLLHFVGDIEQPMHCSTAVFASQPSGDAGGNGFSLTGKWSNMHSLWDAGGGYLVNWSRPLSASSQTALNNRVAAIEADFPYNPNPGTIPDPMDWARAGRDLARTNAYVGITQGTSPSSTYTNRAQATTEQLMAEGGHRLADLLNTLFTTNAVRLVFAPAASSFRFSWSAIPGRVYHVQYKQLLSDPTWNALTNIAVATNLIYFSETRSQPQRYYRVTQ